MTTYDPLNSLRPRAMGPETRPAEIIAGAYILRYVEPQWAKSQAMYALSLGRKYVSMDDYGAAYLDRLRDAAVLIIRDADAQLAGQV